MKQKLFILLLVFLVPTLICHANEISSLVESSKKLIINKFEELTSNFLYPETYSEKKMKKFETYLKTFDCYQKNLEQLTI